MLLVVDANIVFSALIKGGKTLDVFLLNKRVKKFEFVAPEYLLVEVEKHINEIAEKTKLSVDELEKLFGFLEKEIEFIPFEEFKDLHEKAEQVSPDLDDVQYFALALKLSSAIWSNDKALKQQAVVKVFSTEELLNYVK
ncbi:MAG: PIN domain-containing protein [Candidatus Hydrothermarchaeota archaeon]|nr:PIN domain-containing protein [Candidatus Hydrothermarchaeota archaeon]